MTPHARVTAGMSRKAWARRHALLLRHNHSFLSVCFLRILQLLQPREPDKGCSSEVCFAAQRSAQGARAAALLTRA